MRVVYITRGFGDYLIDLLNAMVSDTEVHIVLTKGDECVAEHLDPRINVWFSKAPRVGSLGNLAAMLRTSRYIKKISPDIIHMQSGVIWELLLKLFLRHVPFILTVHDVTRHPTKQKWIETPQQLLDWGAKLSDAIIVHGEQMKVAARNRFGKACRIFVSHHGIISKYGTGVADLNPSRFNVLLFGRIDAYKGVEYLIKAEPLIRQQIPQVRIIIAGEAQNVDYYQGLVKSDQKIDLRLQRQDDEEVSELYQTADVIALPYTEASQSGVLQVGFAFGIPPVVTAVGGLPDVIFDKKNGLIVPPENPEELAKAIIRLLTDIDLRKTIIEGVIESREGCYNWDIIAADIRTLYCELIPS
ncbi:MAG: glycosyltransferase family 4 protein [Gammaproteobacteria bacterium]|nr:glycosyltransferase family 4 protein [Gammaproteobacteria bacterium]